MVRNDNRIKWRWLAYASLVIGIQRQHQIWISSTADTLIVASLDIDKPRQVQQAYFVDIS